MIWAAMIPVLLTVAIFWGTLRLGKGSSTATTTTTHPGENAEQTRALRRRSKD